MWKLFFLAPLGAWPPSTPTMRQTTRRSVCYHPDRGLFGWPPDPAPPPARITAAQRRRLFRRQDRWRLRPGAADRRSFFVF